MYWLANFSVKKLSSRYMILLGIEYVYGIIRSNNFYNCYEFIIDRYGSSMYRREYIINKNLIMYNQYIDYKLSGRCWLNEIGSRLYMGGCLYNNQMGGCLYNNQTGGCLYNNQTNRTLLCTVLNYANGRHVGAQYAIYTDSHIEIVQVPSINHMDFLSQN